ncbi:MAG TPA: hypothetical protein DCS55_08050 [Acidimicrobiaceae bacterium]|nr:hypothetical protein [Acidimicrobiaceae bacterium]
MTPNTPIHIDLDAQDDELLGVCWTKAFVRDQPCRFEPSGSGDHLSLAWNDGQMIWCATASDALMLRSFERSNGFDAMVLWDLAVAEQERPGDTFVVLSSRPWPHD